MAIPTRGCIMPRPIPVPLRRTMIRLWEQGQAPDQIAEALDVPCPTVRRLIRRFRLRGVAGLDPDYRRASDLVGPASDLKKAVLQYRREHPTWGAGLIRLQLLRGTWVEPVPAVRTLQRWLLRADLAPAPPGRRSKA